MLGTYGKSRHYICAVWASGDASTLLADLDLALPTNVLCYTPEEFARKRRELGIVSLALEEGVRLHEAS